MKPLRKIFAFAVILSTSVLIGTLALDELSNAKHELIIEVSLQTMHISFLIGAAIYIVTFAKKKQFVLLGLMVLPLVLLTFAFIGLTLGKSFSNLSLIVFDFYLIYLFTYLLTKEFRKN